MADNVNPTPINSDAAEVAYVASLPEIQAEPDSTLIPITLDAVSIATSLFGILPELRALRPQLEASLRDFDFVRFDKLEQYGLALTHAHTNYNGMSKPKGEVTEKVAELTKVRDRLYSLALWLVDEGLIDAGKLANCKVELGHRPLIEDVLTLVGVYKGHWAALEGKVTVTPEQLSSARKQAFELMHQLGLREQAPVSAGEAARIRHQAFTLFVRTYEDARRAVVYVRGAHGDADQIVPSFYSLRNAKRRVSGDDASGAAAREGGAGQTPVPPASGAPKAANTPVPPIVINNTAGLPLDSPFIS